MSPESAAYCSLKTNLEKQNSQLCSAAHGCLHVQMWLPSHHKNIHSFPHQLLLVFLFFWPFFFTFVCLTKKRWELTVRDAFYICFCKAAAAGFIYHVFRDFKLAPETYTSVNYKLKNLQVVAFHWTTISLSFDRKKDTKRPLQ